ncbi:unnamed protein product [Tetraodon nigroviridis]|uniref:Chromosome undetermined SCAF14764, whole genome shotgun sequence n=1 Tax=Tetraodon nigroviridis TaxID=99883 RepID=Q4S291_TETNG|nr:unnamed protein product [Tetraodon nigroviridis]
MSHARRSVPCCPNSKRNFAASTNSQRIKQYVQTGNHQNKPLGRWQQHHPASVSSVHSPFPNGQ